jgi:ABC-type branched-subunit amino acid transport system ATPase component
MTYEEAKAFQNQLNEKLDDVTKIFKEKFDQHKGAMGIVPDHIRETPEYQTIKKEIDRSFQALRNFNQWYVKQFKKEILADRKNRYKRAN